MSSVLIPETGHAVLFDIRWETYLALLEDLGEQRGRITYDRGTLEIVSPSLDHEQWKTLVARLIECFTTELGIPILSGGSTPLKSALKRRGAEPDECYYIQNEAAVRGHSEIDLERDPPPDLAIEIDITSLSIKRRDVYAAIGIPEVWTYEDHTLVVRTLDPNSEYQLAAASRAFPTLPIEDVHRFLARRGEVDETTLVRSFIAWVRDRFTTG